MCLVWYAVICTQYSKMVQSHFMHDLLAVKVQEQGRCPCVHACIGDVY